MNGNNIPKRKKNINTLKRSQSEDLLNKTTKRKPAIKKQTQPSLPKSLGVQARNTTKLAKSNNKKKVKHTKAPQKTLIKQKQNIDVHQQSTKTVKKFLKKKKQKQQQLTERKKIHLQYFMYRDVYVPIQNTQQRKIIFKIQLIDQKIKKPRQIPVRRADQVVDAKNQIIKIDTGIQKTDRRIQNMDFQCQTQNEEKSPKFQRVPSVPAVLSQESEQPQKCFAETLSQLQFLYLPDEKNFENFTRSQKAHYKQLLLYMAKKFDEPEEKLLDEETVQVMLQERCLRQRGVNEYYPKKGIPTHTPSIISYISNLFCYLEIHEKSNFIDRINCSYGYSMIERLMRVREEKSTAIQAQLISQATFWRFETELHEGLQFESETVEKALHFHNRAVFDAVNEALLEFQPYYSSQGEPFPWSNNFQTTFYCISQSSYSALVCQIKDKIWQYCTTLAGILLDEDSKHNYKPHYKQILAIQQQMMKTQTSKYNDKVPMDETRTRVLCEIANYVQAEIIKEISMFFL